MASEQPLGGGGYDQPVYHSSNWEIQNAQVIARDIGGPIIGIVSILGRVLDQLEARNKMLELESNISQTEIFNLKMKLEEMRSQFHGLYGQEIL